MLMQNEQNTCTYTKTYQQIYRDNKTASKGVKFHG